MTARKPRNPESTSVRATRRRKILAALDLELLARSGDAEFKGNVVISIPIDRGHIGRFKLSTDRFEPEQE